MLARQGPGQVVAVLAGARAAFGTSAELPESPALPCALATWRPAGWGLPFCFWAATGFAQKKMAAIDAACMVHPARRDVGEQAPAGMFGLAPCPPLAAPRRHCRPTGPTERPHQRHLRGTHALARVPCHVALPVTC